MSFSAHSILVFVFGISGFGGWKTLYICIMAVYFVSSCIVKDPCVGETDRVKRK